MLEEGLTLPKLDNKLDVPDIKEFAVFNLPNIKFDDLEYVKNDKESKNKGRNEFNNRIKADFLKELVCTNEKELRELGIDDVGIKKMKRGYNPKGYQVHHIKPLDDSGNNDKDNFVLINSKDHSKITGYQNSFCKMMNEGDKVVISWPFFDKSYYNSGSR